MLVFKRGPFYFIYYFSIMNRTLARECKERIGKKVLLKGWMHQLRELGKINFLILRDRSGLIQVVLEDQGEIKKLKGLYVGTVLEIEGMIKETTQTDLGVEVGEPSLKVISPVTEPPSVEYNKDDVQAELPTILDNRPITIRNEKLAAVFRVQATILRAFRESMSQQDFTEFRNPVLIGSPSESGADVFEVKYFDRKAYLCQSPQLYKQIMLGAFERVFTVTPVFRAEKHHTSRHLTELTQMDGEMAFIESMDDVHQVVENFIRHVFHVIEEEHVQELALWGVSLPKLPEGRFPKIKVKEGLEIIKKRTGKSADRKLDFEPEDERELGKWVQEEHGTDLLWVTHYYKNKNFYTWNDEESPEESLSYDLLCRGIEWLSGTVRIEDYQEIIANIRKQKLNPDHFKGYLDAFRYGIPPEAGFSLGLERLTQKIFDFDNIRMATLFPRDVERLSP